MTLRLEPETVETLDQLVERFYQKQGLNVTRVDLIRQAIRQYIEREKISAD
jgi:predicted transcriptional regulator